MLRTGQWEISDASRAACAITASNRNSEIVALIEMSSRLRDAERDQTRLWS
jgi:hypothetical protein